MVASAFVLLLQMTPVGLKNPPANDAEARVMKQFVCVCGTCAREPLDTCECAFAAKMRDEVKQKLAAGESAEAIRAALIASYGQTVLASRGPRRPAFLTWFPIVLFSGGGVLLFLLARQSLLRRRGEP